MRRSILPGLLIPCVASFTIPIPQHWLTFGLNSDHGLCPLAPKVELPEDDLLSPLRFVQEDAFLSLQADRLSRAVQVPTTVNDYMKDPYDEKFAPFLDFHKLLESLFPHT